MPKTTMMDPWR